MDVGHLELIEQESCPAPLMIFLTLFSPYKSTDALLICEMHFSWKLTALELNKCSIPKFKGFEEKLPLAGSATFLNSSASSK